MGMARTWRGRLAAPAVALGMLGAALAPAATPSQAQVWGPWGPLPGWDTELPGLPGSLPGPNLGPLSGPGAQVGPGTQMGPIPVLGPTESRALAAFTRVFRSVSRGNGADATSGFGDDATFWISDGIGLCSATPCVGRAAIGPELERQATVHSRYTPLGGDVVGNVGGSSVTGLFDIRSDRVTAAGSERLLATITGDVRNDRLAAVRINLIRDDPQTQRFITWVASQAGGTAAAPGTPPPPAPTVAPFAMPPSAQ
jgi:hypothetical protein